MEYVGGTSKRLWLVRILVLRFVIPEACTYSLSLCYEVGAWFIIDCLPYEWQSRTSDGLFLPIYPPRGMRSSTLLRGLINFCNKYMSSLWLMWVHGLYTLLPFRIFSSLYGTMHCPFSPRELVQTSLVHPNPVIRYALSHINLLISSSKQPPYLPIMAFP